VHEIADAVLLVWYPGEEGGNAVAEILFGKVSPSGRLPVTFPKSFDQLPPYEDYSMKGRTYRYMNSEPLYPFGFGLSYTSFSYDHLTLSKTIISQNESVQAEVRVKNTGKVKSDEVVQLYLTHEGSGLEVPLYALKGFKRITLAPGASQKIRFALTAEMLSLIDESGQSVQPRDQIRIRIGGALPSVRSKNLGATPYAEAVLTVGK
jgi:beta-glucosidase